MASMEQLVEYFSDGIENTRQTVGAEIETQFVNAQGGAIYTVESQQMFLYLSENGWKVETRKGSLITALVDRNGNKISYELGQHNIELATIAATPTTIIKVTKNCLNQIYRAAETVGAHPYFAPILEGTEDLLVIPDERDAIWLELDGRSALAPLARTSSVQFTISVYPREALKILNDFRNKIDMFLADYPQDGVWKKYIQNSLAAYQTDRYGGPLWSGGLFRYCSELMRHKVVQGARLVPFREVEKLDIPLYLRSIWWYFRLRRYGNVLCIEVRPMPRREDREIEIQLEKVLAFI